jgi:pimeloyl-ACP methyl ester carboxylesterase
MPPGGRRPGGHRDLRATALAMQLAGRVSATAAAPLAARLWFTPWSAPPSPEGVRREAAWLARTRPVTFPAGARTLAGFTAGEGPAVLLVHGWGDRASRLGAFVEPLSAAGYRVVGVDLPAHGDRGPRQTHVYEQAAAVRAVAGQLGAVDAVVAHSMGGLVATVALSQGLEVRAVALLAPAVRLDHALDRFADQFSMPPRARAGLRRVLERRFGRGVWEDLAADALAARLALPALVVHDADDPQVAFADGAALAGAWPGAQLLPTRGLGHRRIIRDAQVVQRVTAFLADGRG